MRINISSYKKHFKGDKVIWLVAFILSLFSIASVYSSSGLYCYLNQSGNTEFFLFKHTIMIALGFVLMFFTHNIKYTYFSRLSQLALFIAIPLLLLTLLKGSEINNAARWLEIPFIGIRFQTSDFGKLALLLYLARLLSLKQENIKDFKSAFIPIMVPILIVCALILPANFSTAAILFTTSVILIYIGRINMKYIFALIGLAIIGFSLLVLIAKTNPEVLPRLNTWINRVVAWQSGDNEMNYQVNQSLTAISSGGIFGNAPGHSVQKKFLHSPYSDFIYAIIIEEYGLAGGLIIMLLYLTLLFRGVRIVTKIPGTFGALMAMGICFSLVFQAMINMAIAVNLLPVSGQTLPLVSYGGTSIWFTCIALGIILSVSREAEEETKNENKELELSK